MEKKRINNLLYGLIIFQPIFDVLIYFLRIKFGFDSIILSCVRPLLALILYIFVLINNKTSKKEKIYSFIFLLIYFIYGIIHLTNINNYLYIDVKSSLLNECRYLFNCGYYLLQLINFYFVYKISDKEERKKIILSLVIASTVMCAMYLISIITNTSGLTYEKSTKFGFKGWSVSAHYIGHSCSYVLPIILYSIFEKKHIKGWFKYIIVLLPVTVSYYLVGTKTPFFATILIFVGYTLFYLIDIFFKKKHSNGDFKFLLIVSIILLCTLTKTYGYSNFYNQIKVSQNEYSYDEIETEKPIYDADDLIDIKDENNKDFEFINRLDLVSTKMKEKDYKVFDNRNVQIKYNSYLRDLSPLKDKLFGYGYFTMVNSMWVENDVMGIYYSFGIVGFILIIIVPLIFMVFAGLGCLLKFKDLNSGKLLLGYSFGISLIIITFVGYTLLFSQTVFYLILLWIVAFFEFKERKYKKKKNYLFMINDLNVGGAEVGLVDVINELSKTSTVDLVLLRKEGPLLERINKKVEIHEILNKNYSKLKRKIYHIFYFMGGIFTKYVYYKTIPNEYDVEVSYLEGYPAVFIASSTNDNSLKIASIRVGLKKHKLSADKIPFGKIITKNAYAKFDKIYTVSKETTDEFIEKYPFCKSKTSTIYTYFNKEYINEQGEQNVETGFDKNYINFLAVGRFSAQKDYGKLVEAFNKLRKEHDNVKLHILGNYKTPEGEQIIEYIKNNKLEKDIILHGVISNPYPYMKHCDVLVSSSNYEGFPRVINEALCLKKLCIGTNVTGTKEALAGNKGILVENSIEGLYLAMLNVVKNKNIYKEYEQQIKMFDGNKKSFFDGLKILSEKKQKMIVFNAKLSYGGLEASMVNLINEAKLNEKYDLTIFLTYFGKSNYLKDLPTNINIKCACPSNWNIFGKLRAICYFVYSYMYFLVNKYDIAICYTHHHPILAKLSRLSSNKNFVFIHSNIIEGTTEKQQKKYKRCHYEKFKNIICVSDNGKKALTKFINRKERVYTINNFIDGKKVLENANIEIRDFKFDENKIYFINVGRHDEDVKKLTRIINATNKLNKEYDNFEVLFIGDGEADKLYEEQIKKLNIKNIHLLGKKIPPYNYMKKCDACLTSSIREGYPVVYIESMILNLPILTVDVSDAKKDVHKKYGIVVENNDDSIYFAMKEFLDKGFIIKKEFDYKKFNEKINNQLSKLFEERN